MKKYTCILFSGLLMLIFITTNAQNTAITVGGDIDKFYPVLFKDNNWNYNKATVLEIGRSNVHYNSSWRGSLIAKFAFHVSQYGHGSTFIDTDIKSSVDFIAGWEDATGQNASLNIIIWLKGGEITYYLNCSAQLEYEVHDGISFPVPYQEENGPLRTYKTEVDSYVNTYGIALTSPVYLNSTATSFFNGSLGIGTKEMAAGEKLSVNGKIRAKEIKVETANWPDYVFDESYQLPDLKETEHFIKTNKHLPGIPSAKEVEEHGVSLGEMNAKLLKKIEELTLHLIAKEVKMNQMEVSLQELSLKIDELKAKP
ncbi:hypothetical protein [Pseudopedobacter beijingensis]|uniref:Uncharacterized protein n=1 Tax=Pseudopedobacter beijingensis TaxID=1207056 RepID=A0ABW4IGV5_9SPHI